MSLLASSHRTAPVLPVLDAARTFRDSYDALIESVRQAVANGARRSEIAAAAGVSGETVSRWLRSTTEGGIMPPRRNSRPVGTVDPHHVRPRRPLPWEITNPAPAR